MRHANSLLTAVAILACAVAPACAAGAGWAANHAEPGFFSDSYSVSPPAAGGVLQMGLADCRDVELHAVTVNGRGVILSPDGRFAVETLLPGAAALVVTVTGQAAPVASGSGPAHYVLMLQVDSAEPELRADLR